MPYVYIINNVDEATNVAGSSDSLNLWPFQVVSGVSVRSTQTLVLMPRNVTSEVKLQESLFHRSRSMFLF